MTSPSLTTSQNSAVERCYEHDATLLVGAMGTGKTAVAVHTVHYVLRDDVAQRVLIVAPLRVAREVWLQEFSKWGSELRVGLAVGNPDIRESVLKSAEYDVVVTNFENVDGDRRKGWYELFDGLVIDEVSRCKTPGAKVVKALRTLNKQIRWAVGLTGTPVSDNWLSLYAMAVVLDGGLTLGRSFDKFRRQFFQPVDFEQHQWEIRPGAESELTAAAAPLLYVMPDYRAGLPELRMNYVSVELPKDGREAYVEMATDMMFGGAEAVNEAVLVGKLQQIASGILYTEFGPLRLHTAKIDRAVELTREGRWVIVYWFKEDLARLREAFPGAWVAGEDKAAIAAWNSGRAPVLLLHPRSAGHGLNLQAGGHQMLWLGPQWSRDLHDQTIARLWRSGQKKPVECVILYARDTIDEAVLARLESKEAYDAELRAHYGALDGLRQGF